MGHHQCWDKCLPGLDLQAYLIPLEELKRVQKGLAQEEERRAEAESSLQCATLDMESLQAELEAVARAEAEQQSKLSLQLEYAKQVCKQ